MYRKDFKDYRSEIKTRNQLIESPNSIKVDGLKSYFIFKISQVILILGGKAYFLLPIFTHTLVTRSPNSSTNLESDYHFTILKYHFNSSKTSP